MSAWIVSKAHIDRMVKTAIAWGIAPRDKSYNELGRMLWVENLNSVKYRYPNDTSGKRPGPSGLTDEDIENYEYDGGDELTPVEALSASRCLDYQSCEHDEWPASDARKFLDIFEIEAVARDGRPLETILDSSEYDRAPWGFEE